MAIVVPRDDVAWELIDQGWSWLIISQVAEATWPMLPSMLQSACNASNAISKEVNELEMAAQLAAMLQHNMSLPDAKAKLQASTTVLPEVVNHVGHFVINFAGGPSFPFIGFLQKFSLLFAIKLNQFKCSCQCHVYSSTLLKAFVATQYMKIL